MKTIIGSAIAIACVLGNAGAALAVEVMDLPTQPGPSPTFIASDYKAHFVDHESADGVKPWQAYSDPASESVPSVDVSFHTGIRGHTPPQQEQKTAEKIFGHEQKNYRFGDDDKYDASRFEGYQHHGAWKYEDYADYCTPVPEPQTYALLIAGLGLLTVVARRRKAAAR